LQFYQCRDINILKIKKELEKMNKIIKAQIYFDGNIIAENALILTFLLRVKRLTN